MTLLAYGFRPFFMLAGLWAVVPLGAAVWAVAGGGWPADAPAPFLWHGREMLFGFTAAAIGGFLLTAVPSWTGTRAVSGLPLAALVALWIHARMAAAPFWQPELMPLRLLSLAFFPALAVMLAVPLVRSRKLRNLPFLVLLGLLFLAELLVRAPAFGWFAAPPFDPLRLAVNTVMLIAAVVGGRIVPAFTRNALRAAGRDAPIHARPWVDTAALVAVAGVLVVDLVAPATQAAGLIAAIAAALLGWRMSGWQGWATRRQPLLWVLHVGYGWLVVGLALKAAFILGGFGWAVNWLHALTAGGFGTLILGVTTRAALGHTGRELTVPLPMAIAYGLVSVAAALRIWGPALLPGRSIGVLTAAALVWVTAWLVYLIVFTPILTQPRADGRPG